MAYEFFDDVAFYFVLQSLLSVFLLPPSFYYLYHFFFSRFCARAEKHDRKLAIAGECRCADCIARQKGKVEATKLSDLVTWKSVLMVLGWLIFIYLWIQLPQYEETELISFKPYEIMGLEPTATEAEIKKQWRRLSVKLHPDKNPDDPEAHTNFLKLKKAYEALTDPVAMENMQKYGNPDGYQGISLTIGLPSWLTRKENEMRILLLYFLVMIVIPPIAVYYWYKNSQLYAESGVMNQSLWQFNQYIKEHMTLKYFIEILAAAAENLALRDRPTVKKDLTLLHNDVSDSMAKPKFEKEKFLWIFKCNVLWHAYLLRREIPASMQFEMNYMLKHAHKLLEGMLNMSVMQKFYKPTLDIITLMQYVTQGCYLDEKHYEKYQKQLPLKQLPHFTEEIINKCKSLGISWRAFRDMEPEKRREVLSLTPQQWEDVEAVIQRIPRIYMAYRYEVEDEEGIYQGDIIQLTVKMQRRRVGLKPEELISPYEPGMEPGERTKTLRNRKEASKKKSYEERINELPMAAKPKIPQLKGEAPWVHSLRFPYPKQEKWWLLLIEHVKKECDQCRHFPSVLFCPMCNKTYCPNCDMLVHKRPKKEDEPSMDHPRFPIPSSRIAHIQKLGAFVDKEEVKIFLRPPFKGVFSYELHARCDSYLGSDSSAEFKIEVKPVEEAPEVKKEDEGADDDPIDEEEKPAEPKWYYCYCTSLFEMLANAAVLIALGFVLQNFLQQRGYWQKYVTPIFDRLHLLWVPIWKSIHPIVGPVYDPLAQWASSLFSYLADKLTAMPPPPVKPTA